MPRQVEVASLLIDIEAELRRLDLWQAESPSARALASTEPFCIDTLTFPQWLQFVFLRRMTVLLEQAQVLPDRCSIAPMADEFFKRLLWPQAKPLVAAIEALDCLLSGQGGGD
ncbi:MAG: YqcC family protein [Spongiibacteraceae bacterium]|jgi:uncharacterized protein YqcC (DUF446 family)